MPESLPQKPPKSPFCWYDSSLTCGFAHEAQRILLQDAKRCYEVVKSRKGGAYAFTEAKKVASAKTSLMDLPSRNGSSTNSEAVETSSLASI